MSGEFNVSVPVEPRADQRKVAKELRGFYVALLSEGFSSDEALRIISYMLAGKQEG